MSDPAALPLMSILRLPRAPDSSRGFSERHSRRDHSQTPSREEQRARAELRRRFLLLLGLSRGRSARFCLRSQVLVSAEFGASDRECSRIQVDSLRTPLGVQGAALLRASDVLEFSFPLELPSREFSFPLE